MNTETGAVDPFYVVLRQETAAVAAIVDLARKDVESTLLALQGGVVLTLVRAWGYLRGRVPVIMCLCF